MNKNIIYFFSILAIFLLFSCSEPEGNSNAECSFDNPTGVCKDEGKRCINGNCVTDNDYCSKTNRSGYCKDGKICIDGECQKQDNSPCSLEHLNGKCKKNKTCINGNCLDNSGLCSKTNPNGYCKYKASCINGKCIQKACNLGDVKTCYSGDPSKLNKGICQPGRQICDNEGKWGECKNSVEPQEEICDGVDNNCNGDIDEGVLNACGKCGEVPNEIPNNHIDDDCDGLTDEDASGNENCDERTHQPCYTGENPSNSGKGICHGGFRDCVNGSWGTCVGQVLPQTEVCGDGIDNDCDGFTDEFCEFVECKAVSDHEICDNFIDDDCNGLINDGCSETERTDCIDSEICGDGLDNDCNGDIDDGCGSCSENETRVCYSGDPSVLSKDNRCKKGTMSCLGGELWGECTGQVLPTKETCNGIDDDCDGIIDNNAIDGNVCGICSNQVPIEICGDGIDNDCDTLIDENCPDSCEASEEVCDGKDNDCDGLTDEGVLNSCGTCGESCYTADIKDDKLDNGEFDGTGRVNGGVTLQETHRDSNFIWIANSIDGTLNKINTKTGDIFGPFTVGINPSRTAVTRDGGVWVGNRGHNGGGDGHSVTHLDPDGNHIATVQLAIDCEPRALALDKYENLWVGCLDIMGFANNSTNGFIYKISSDGVVANGYPFESGVGLYGFAIDGNGILWSSRLNDSSAPKTIARIDTSKNPGEQDFFRKVPFEYSTYGIVIDFYGNIWYGGADQNDIKKMSYKMSTNEATVRSFPMPGCIADPTANPKVWGIVRGIAIDKQNNIWAICTEQHILSKYDMMGTLLNSYDTHGLNPIGVGVDPEGDIWVMNYSSANAVEFDNNGTFKREFSIGQGPYSYSDITGFNLVNITAPVGIFKIIEDTNREDATYDSVRVVGQTPGGSHIRVRARVSNDKVSWSHWSNNVDYVNNNSDMPLVWNGAKPAGKFIQVEVTLEIGNNDTKPIFSEIYIKWQRP